MKNSLRIILGAFVLTSIMIGCSNTSKKTVSNSQTIYYGGDIITMQGATPNYAEAIVTDNDKIIFVGNKVEAEKQYGNITQHDLKGKTMLPAFLDAHGHFYSVGFASTCANILPPPDGPGHNFNTIINTLNTWKDAEEGKYFINKLGWIIGNGYDDSQLEEQDHPKAIDLDKISTEVPVLVLHQSGHLGAINTVAMQMLGYDIDTTDPKGGSYRRNADGSPNGVLEEAALFKILFPIIGQTDPEFALKCISKGQEEYAKKGYLTAQDGRTTVEQMALLKAAADNGKFYIDVVSYPDIALGTASITEDYYSVDHQYKNKYRIGGVKLTLDGSPQGKTAWLSSPYHVPPAGKDKDYNGYAIFNDEKATEFVKLAFKNKWQLLCHTNGDAAIDQYIKAVAEAEEEFGYDDHRTVLIHGQTLRKDQIPELVKYKMYPSLFPMHTFYWGDWHASSVLGHPRADYISPCRDVIDAGLNLTSHHDAPVTFPNSMRVLDATVNRVTRSGVVLGPDQRISVYEGLKTLTIWAANQYFEEDNKGTIAVGKLADLVILNQNPLKVKSLDINKIEILESIKEGTSVFKK